MSVIRWLLVGVVGLLTGCSETPYEQKCIDGLFYYRDKNSVSKIWVQGKSPYSNDVVLCRNDGD